jgi:hypothetical protein
MTSAGIIFFVNTILILTRQNYPDSSVQSVNSRIQRSRFEFANLERFKV